MATGINKKQDRRTSETPDEPSHDEISEALRMKREHDERVQREATCIEIMNDAMSRCQALGFDVIVDLHVRGDRVVSNGLVVVPMV